jgi:hypothetical protein
MMPQPFAQLDHFTIGRHPGRPARERAENRFRGVTCVGVSFDVPVDAVAIGPIAFDGDEGEAVILEESAGEYRAPAVELGGAVRRFSEENVTRVFRELR